VRLIERDELKRKLDEQEQLKLVCALSESGYRAVHIPGSLHVDSLAKAAELLRKDDEIVVYCTNVTCVLSITLYHHLVDDGYQDVRRYAGGIEDWEEAGYPLASLRS
jgi:rhodanese-related sulfurtransferase